MPDLTSYGFDYAPDATLILTDRVIRHANLMVEQLFGWPPAELIGQSMRVLYPGQADFRRIGSEAVKAMTAHGQHADERFMRRRDGHLIWVAGRGRAIDPAQPEKLAVWSYRLLEEAPAPVGQLTATERRVASHLVNGLTSKEIAQALAISPRTVEVHRANMIRKLQVRNSFELVRRLLSQDAR